MSREVSERTGLPAVVLPAEVGDEVWYRILLGSFADQDAAAAAAQPLLRSRTIRQVVLRPVPESVVGELGGEVPKSAAP